MKSESRSRPSAVSRRTVSVSSAPLHGRARLQALLYIVRRTAGTGIRWLTQQEAVVLVALLMLVLSLFGFVKIAEELGEGELVGFDEWLLRLLRVPGQPHLPIGPAWLLEAAQDNTLMGGRTMLVSVVVFAIGYLALEGKYGAIWIVTAAAAGGGILETVLKRLFDRGRPSVVPHLVAVTSPSFPSGHSMLGAIMYLTFGALLARFSTRRRTRIYLLTVAVLTTVVVGVSRVYLGVHYPSDVLAGWCAGLIWALTCWLVARYLQYRGTIDRSGRM